MLWTRRRRRRMLFWVVAVVGLLFAGAYFSSAEVIELRVEERDRVQERSGKGSRTAYLVWTGEEVFEVADSFVFMTFEREENFERLRPGRTYRVAVAGWNLGNFGSLGRRDIIDVLER